MSYSGAVRAVAMGILLAAVTACGGGGGSGGDDGDGSSQRPNVPLPDVGSATQTVLTPDNSKQAIILALNTISFVQDGTIPAPASVDFYADSFADANVFSKASRKMRALRPEGKTIDVSDQICVSGSATADAGSSLIGKMVQHYRNCDTGDVTLDGDLELNIRDYIYSDTFTDVTYTFHGLRMTDGQSDTVFDGSVVMTTAYPGAGFIAADLDIRDLKALKGIRVVDYRADFDIDYASNYYGNYVYFVRQLHGRIYSEGEYFDLGLTAGHEPWPMLVGKSSNLTLSPSGMAAPYQVRIALDVNGDNGAEYWLFADLAQLSVGSTNNSAPEFHFDAAPIRLDKGETREVWFGSVTDADQQFVSVSWQLAEKPEGSDPLVDASADGFVFSSNVSGDYRFLVTASDGLHTATKDLNVRVMYDMPQIGVDVPASINADQTISFHVDMLNPEQGNVTVTPLAIPGLSYDRGAATFHPAIPNFGVDQQINIGFVVANEDRRQTVTFPVMVIASENSSKPMMLAADNGGWYSSAKNWPGQFSDDGSVEVIQAGYQFLHLSEIEPAGKRYRESFDIVSELNSSNFLVLGVSDVNDDGIDDVILAVESNLDGYICVFDVKRRQVILKYRVESSTYNLQSYKVVVADLDGDGQKELSLLSSNRIMIFDGNLNLLWQSEQGSFGSFLLAANFDNDAALELITETGYVLDGATWTWQQQRGFYANGYDFFAIDTDGNGISEVYLAGERSLQKMTQSGYVTYDIGASIYSNFLIRNVDNDAAPELVFVTGHDSGSVQTPFPPSWYEAAVSLAYVDFDGASPSVNLIRELQRGYYFNYSLLYADVDDDGGSEYLGLVNNSSSSTSTSFVYDEDTDSQSLFGDFGLRLTESPKGGVPITVAGDKLAFCGEFIYGGAYSSKSDLFTLDLESVTLGDELTALIDGASSTLSDYAQCYSTGLQGSDGIYMVTVGNSASYPYYDQSVEIKIQDANTGEAVFSLHENIGIFVSVSAIGDIDGDHKSDIIVGGGSKLAVFGIESGDKRASHDFGYDTISHIAVADVIAGNGKDEIVVRTSGQVQILVDDTQGGFTVGATYTDTGNYYYGDSKHLQVFDANGDGRNEVVISQTSDASSDHFEFEVLDAELKPMASWTASGYVDTVVPYAAENGSTLLVSLERNYYYQGSYLVWRDPMTGQEISRSAELPQGYFELSLVFDAQASKLRAILAGNSRVYITQ
jgi:hypothetical protein